MSYFITAIGTDSGKTVVSAILTEAFQYDYWKPIQCGEPRDTESVKQLISNSETCFHNETYFLKTPASPHYAAEVQRVEINLDEIQNSFNKIEKPCIIEGAGGLMVPVNGTEFLVDIPEKLNIPVVLVCNLYLGSINHSLLSINELKRRNVKVAGIIFNGESNPASEDFILEYSGYKKLLHIANEKHINQLVIKKYTDKLKSVQFMY